MFPESRLKPYLECKDYFKQLARRCLNDQNLIVKEEIIFLIDFLTGLNQIENTETLVKCIKICVFNIINLNDPNKDYENYIYMKKHIIQHHGIFWMVDNYFNKPHVNKYYSILMTNLLNPTKQSALKFANTFAMDSLKFTGYKYFLIKLVYFNVHNKLKTLNEIETNIKNVFEVDDKLDKLEKIINCLSNQTIYSHKKFTEIVLNMNLILVENT